MDKKSKRAATLIIFLCWAAYTAADALPSGGTDYFVRIREGESDLEWVELQGTLTFTNDVTGGNEIVRLLTPDKRMPCQNK